MSNEMISIIVPVYNVKEYLEKCVESILNQSYKNFELILVDDGSTDGSGDICDYYETKDKRVKVAHTINGGGGAGAPRNVGINMSAGAFIAFVDSDDYIEPNMYADMIECMNAADSDLAICGMVTESGLRAVNSKIPKRNTIWNGPEAILEEYFHIGYITGYATNKVFRRHLFDCIRFPEGTIKEDVSIMHHVFGECNRAVHTGRHYYHYVNNDGSITHQKFQPKQLISVSIAEERKDFVKAKYPNLLSYAETSCYGSRLSAIKKITRSHMTKTYTEIYNELKEYIRTHDAPTAEMSRTRFLILYCPAIYRLGLDYNHIFRKKAKAIALKSLRAIRKLQGGI